MRVKYSNLVRPRRGAASLPLAPARQRRNPFHTDTDHADTDHTGAAYKRSLQKVGSERHSSNINICRRLYFVGAEEEEDEDAAILADRHHLFVVQTEIDGDHGL